MSTLVVEPAEFDFGLVENVFPGRGQIFPGPVNIEIEHTHGGLIRRLGFFASTVFSRAG